MSIKYKGIDMFNRIKIYEGINPRGNYIDFKDEKGNIIKNIHSIGYYPNSCLHSNDYLPVYRDKGRNIRFELIPKQFGYIS